MSEHQNRVKQVEDIAATPLNAEGLDEESEALSNSPQFLAILEQARAQKGKGGFSSEEMGHWLNTELSAI